MKPLVDMNMNDLIHRSAEKYGSCCAVRYKDAALTYRELDEATDHIAAGLIRCGIRQGDHVAIWSENSLRSLLLFYSTEKAGAIACMLNASLKADSILELLKLSDIRTLIIGSSFKDICFYDELSMITKDYRFDRIIDLADAPHPDCIPYDDLKDTPVTPSEKAIFAAVDPHDDGLILYTSCTTGSVPKAVVSSYYNLVNGGIQKADAQNMTSSDRVCLALQIFHIFGIDVAMLASLAVGACLIIPDDSHTISILKAIEQYKCTVLSCVPFVYFAMMERKDFHSFDLSSLRTGVVGGASCSPELFCRIEKEFGFTLLPGLGQTEATAGIAIASPEDSLTIRSTTVGRFVPHSEGRIIDMQTALPVPANTIGEILFKSPLVMSRYHNQPEQTKEAIDDEGWLHTGDLGWLDDDGYIHLEGRIKEMINRGGEKIIPAEIEAELLKLPGIGQAKVIGVPDDTLGEAVCACIIPEPGHELDENTIRSDLQKHLAKFMIPKYILFMHEFPRNANNKIQMPDLKKQVRTLLRI